jgi:hypothetical protein
MNAAYCAKGEYDFYVVITETDGKFQAEAKPTIYCPLPGATGPVANNEVDAVLGLKKAITPRPVHFEVVNNFTEYKTRFVCSLL